MFLLIITNVIYFYLFSSDFYFSKNLKIAKVEEKPVCFLLLLDFNINNVKIDFPRKSILVIKNIILKL
jgi:hypothetical protein